MSLIGHVYLLPEAQVSRLVAGALDVEAVIDGAYNAPEQGFVDLDKAWHALHYLLTGTSRDGAGPLAFLLKGGTPLGPELSELGSARVFTPTEAAAIADALAEVSQQKLLPRFDPKKFERLELYPGRWAEINPRSEYDLGYYFGPLEQLKNVMRRAKLEGHGVLTWIS
jgi:Domain of unknown function (DUF1877)